MSNSYKKISKLCLLLGAGLAFFVPIAAAQNTGGVIGPVINEGYKEVQYRLAFVPEEDGSGDRYAQRVHGAVALDKRRMARLVIQGSDRGGPDGFDFQYVQAELFWELSDEQATQWNSGLRFDARISDGDAPDQLGLNWSNQFRLTDRLSARAVALTAVQFGDNAADGVLLSARSGLFYKVSPRYNLALESYNSLGSSDDFGVKGRSQQIGPVFTVRLDDGWTWSLGNLFGLNDATPDNDIRFWFGRSF